MCSQIAWVLKVNGHGLHALFQPAWPVLNPVYGFEKITVDGVPVYMHLGANAVLVGADFSQQLQWHGAMPGDGRQPV